MALFGPKMGTWYFESQSDPRFNKTGRDVVSISMDVPDWPAERAKELECDVPADLMFGWTKD